MKRSLKLIALLLSFLSLNLIVPVANAAGVLGDIDGDSYITFADARLALRFSAGMELPSSAQKTASDMNKDGKITLEDVKSNLKTMLHL